MAKQTYRVVGTTKWMGASGNALLAFYNKPGSGKKISIQHVEIYNQTILQNQNGASTNLNAPTPVRIRVSRVTGAAGGYSLTPAPMNSSLSAWPATVQVKTGTSLNLQFSNVSVALTCNNITAVGNTVFTPQTAPSWVTNEQRDSERMLYVPSGNNARYYSIVSSNVTSLTVETTDAVPAAGGFANAGFTTGVLVEPVCISLSGFVKQALPSAAIFPYSSIGHLHRKNQNSGTVFEGGFHSNLENIIVRAGEQVVVYTTRVNCNMPVSVEMKLIVNGSPNRTYVVSFFTWLGPLTSILTVDNNSGSGEVVQISDIGISELGTQDTPYFQMVPIGSIDPICFVDTDKQVNAISMDSTQSNLTSNICSIFVNAPVLPYGVPVSYIGEGAPAAAVPRGFNYLNSKDFLGPVYATYFPEAAAYKNNNTGFWTQSVPGTLGTQISQAWSIIKGGAGAPPVVIREGEAVGIVSGAETATLSTAIGISGWGAFDFAVTFAVENATTPYLTLTGLKDNTEIRVYDHTSGTELTGTESVTDGTTNNRTFSWAYDYTAGLAVDIMIVSLGYAIIRLDNVALSTTGVTVPIQQQTDRWYSNP